MCCVEDKGSLFKWKMGSSRFGFQLNTLLNNQYSKHHHRHHHEKGNKQQKKEKKNETVTFVFLQVFPINSIFTFRETHT